MLHYAGDLLALELGESAKTYLPLYHGGLSTILVPFYDLRLKRVRYARFEWLAEQWVFTDLTG